MRWSPVSLAVLLSALLTVVSLACRPLIPIDETRYLAVAWEMRTDGDYLVPHLGGVPYSHKPPLLFWLINLVWSVTGVEEWSARLVGPVAGMVCLVLTARLARRLWSVDAHGTRATEEGAALILASTSLWMMFAPMTMFDTLLSLSALAAILGWHRAAAGDRWTGFTFAAGAIGVGLLTKGPVCLVHILPVALGAPLWWTRDRAPRPAAWYAGVAVSVLSGAALALLWAIPAARSGGPEYGNAILWGQTAGRLTNSFAHGRPFWWYAPLIPLAFLPWSWSLAAWRGRPTPSAPQDRGVRLCLLWGLASLAALCFVSGKQIHYLIPVLPPFALLLARHLTKRDATPGRVGVGLVGAATVVGGLMIMARPALAFLPERLTDPALCPIGWGLPIAAVGLLLMWGARKDRGALVDLRRVAVASIVNACLFQIAVKQGIFDHFDVTPVSRQIARLQDRGIEILHDRAYHNEFHFAGRLTRPIASALTAEDRDRWIRQHPDGWIVRTFESREDPELAQAADLFPYCRDFVPEWIALIPAARLGTRTTAEAIGPQETSSR